LPNYFDIFPAMHGHIGFGALQVLSLFGITPESAAKIAMEVQFPGSVAEATIGVQNTFFVGAAYASFGWLGVVLSPVWVGIVMLLALKFAISLRKSPLGIGTAVWLMYQITRALSGGFISEFTVNTNIIGTLGMVAMTHLFLNGLARSPSRIPVQS
jgi:hypothetical protein